VLSSLLVVSLLAASPGSSNNVHLASPGLASSGVTAAEVQGLTEHLDRQLARQGVRISSAGAMRRSVPQERWSSIFECNWTQPRCLAQYGEAFGVNAVVTGEVSRGQAGYALQVRVRSVKDATVLAEEYVTGYGMPELQGAVTRLAPRLADQVALGLGTRLDRPTSYRVWALVPMGAGIAATGAGALLFISARGKRDDIARGFPDGPPTPLEAFQLAESGKKEQRWGAVLLGAGAAAIVGSIIFYRSHEADDPKDLITGVSVGPSGLVVTGVLP
jgi:hypothetical protein